MITHIRLPLLIGTVCLVLTGCNSNPPAVSTVSIPKTNSPAKRKPVIAVALGGGGAKGYAHIGVLKILESHGIKPDIVTGTSAGSLVGSMYASGLTPYQLQQNALVMEESDLRSFTLSKQGILSGTKIRDYVNKNVKNKPIQSFPIKFAAVATELDTGNPKIFDMGNAGLAVQASSSIPNLFVPPVINGKKYVDGGLVSPIPVSAARQLGADIVIAVDISARPKNQQTISMTGLLDQTINIMSQTAIKQELQKADVVISPAVTHLGLLDLNQKNISIIEGEKAAQAKIALINSKIKQFYDAQK